MNIDLHQPITIFIYLLFGFGGVIWADWFKQQLELSIKNPKKASLQITRLNIAFRKFLTFFSYGFLLIVFIITFIIGLQIYLNQDKLSGIALIILSISFVLQILAIIVNNRFLLDLGRMAIAILGITQGFWWYFNNWITFAFFIGIPAVLTFIRQIVIIIRTDYQNSKPNISKRIIYLFVIYFLLLLFVKITSITLKGVISLELLKVLLVMSLLLIIGLLVYMNKLKTYPKPNSPLQSYFQISLLVENLLVIELYLTQGNLKDFDIFILKLIFLVDLFIVAKWLQRLLLIYFPDIEVLRASRKKK